MASAPAWADMPLATESARLRTFAAFPTPSGSTTVTPAALAAAGFYYNPVSGSPDQCTCFCCGVSLVQWEPSDIPATEHRRHSANCPFLAATGRLGPDGGGGGCEADPAGDVAALLQMPPPSELRALQGGSEGARQPSWSRDLLQACILGQAAAAADEGWTCGDVSLAALPASDSPQSAGQLLQRHRAAVAAQAAGETAGGCAASAAEAAAAPAAASSSSPESRPAPQPPPAAAAAAAAEGGGDARAAPRGGGGGPPGPPQPAPAGGEALRPLAAAAASGGGSSFPRPGPRHAAASAGGRRGGGEAGPSAAARCEQSKHAAAEAATAGGAAGAGGFEERVRPRRRDPGELAPPEPDA
eukprot:TRINITY_DN70506_c0_g1_i1.p2 TRINITY_DN70506_c0_g1~~TRINITY_DN70506_c0_g1_i1.p2  ORF type:complete len:357 (+),score=91.54 TRINITY_DN70506_c0_g1_i1:116-1186(+)